MGDRKYLSNSGFDAFVLHQLRHHCPNNNIRRFSRDQLPTGNNTLIRERERNKEMYLSMETRWAALRPSLRCVIEAAVGGGIE
jgi:hypothetical protein